MKNISVIIPAAGYGKRMETKIPKQLIEINNLPIIYYTLMRFHDDQRIKEIIITVSEEIKKQITEICNKINSFAKIKIILGGAKRQDSVANGINEVGNNIDIILIHDAVRPFFSKNIINTGLELLEKYDGAIAAVPTINTIKIVKNNLIKETPPRKTLYRINTPQMFNKESILRAYAYAKENNYYGTDDSMLMEKIGGKIAIIPDSYNNIKITNKNDLKIAKEVLNGN